MDRNKTRLAGIATLATVAYALYRVRSADWELDVESSSADEVEPVTTAN